MTSIYYGSRLAAVVNSAVIRLRPWVDSYESDHPIRRWITCQAVFAQDVLLGEITGSWSPSRAEHFARTVLMPDDEFAIRVDWADVDLAEAFRVPLQQIVEKRIDLEARRLATGRAG